LIDFFFVSSFFCKILIFPSSVENLCFRSRALIRAITPARVFPPFYHLALINTRRRGTVDLRERRTTAGGIR